MGSKAPAIEVHLGSVDLVRAYLLSHTLMEAAREFGSTYGAAKVWEKKYDVRCKRRCNVCHNVVPYAEMHVAANGRAHECRECVKAARPQRPDRGSAAETIEYRLVPDIFYAITRAAISPDTGRWQRWEYDGA